MELKLQWKGCMTDNEGANIKVFTCLLRNVPGLTCCSALGVLDEVEGVLIVSHILSR